MTLEQIAALNIFGKGAIALFLIAGLGAALSGLQVVPQMAALRKRGVSIWADADGRSKFLRFIEFCALGPISVLIGFASGGWPHR